MSDYHWDWPASESYPDGTIHSSQPQHTTSTLNDQAAATSGSTSGSIGGNYYGGYDHSSSAYHSNVPDSFTGSYHHNSTTDPTDPTGSSVTYYPNDNSVVLAANYPSSSQSVISAYHPGPSNSSIIQGGSNFPTQPSVQSFQSSQPNAQQHVMQPPLGSASHGHYRSFSSNTTSYGDSVAKVPSLGIGHGLPTTAADTTSYGSSVAQMPSFGIDHGLPATAAESVTTGDFLDVSKLNRGVRPLTTKHKNRASKRKTFLSSKPAPSEPMSMSLAPPTKPTAELLRDVKEGAITKMFQNLFQENLFPGTGDLTRLATKSIDDAVDKYPQSKVELESWKLTSSDVKALMSRLKGTTKTIHSDFRSIAEAIILPAYELSLDTSGLQSKTGMLASRTAFIGSLLMNDTFADMFRQLQMPDGTLQTVRIPFGNQSLLYLLEYVVEDLQYSRYLCLNDPGWKSRLQNAIYLAAASCGWALYKRFKGLNLEFASEQMNIRYTHFVDRWARMTADERRLFEEEVLNFCRVLK